MTYPLPQGIAEEIRIVLEFHRWGGRAEGITDRGTLYRDTFGRTREEAHKLQELCRTVSRCLGATLPAQASALISAGRMYRRSADYVKACEYFARALETVYREAGCA
ncbi:MAG: tetratricopeptide repeat protein [Candidatus Glassbacteria bacterium]